MTKNQSRLVVGAACGLLCVLALQGIDTLIADGSMALAVKLATVFAIVLASALVLRRLHRRG